MHVRLTQTQTRVYRSPKRFKVIVAGRRSGKTLLALVFLLTVALLGSGRVCWYVAPSYRMAKNIAWGLLRRIVPRAMMSKDPNESDLTITLKNGSVIQLKGADNPDSLRGVALDAVVLDEYAQMDPDTWELVLRPTLGFGGPAMFIGTPAGYNHFHALYLKALSLSAEEGSEWAVWQFTTAEAGILSAAEIASARQSMSEKQFRQEYEASFEALAGRVYHAFDRRYNVRSDIAWIDRGLEVIVGIDFNVAPGMHATISQMVADQLWFLDEIFIPGGNTQEMCEEIERRYPMQPHPVNPLIERVIQTWPDPTGNARKTNAPVGQTDFTIIREHGFFVNAPSRPYPLADKHNTVNAALCDASGYRRVYVHPRCLRTITAWDGLTFKADTGVPDQASPYIHMADAAAYPICGLMPMLGRVVINSELG